MYTTCAQKAEVLRCFMAHDAKAVANFFLELAEAEGKKLSPMKLQKLVYYAHGWHFGLVGEPLLDEEVQAWSFGPVIRSLYNEFRSFGADEITGRAMRLSHQPGNRLSFSFHHPSLTDSDAGDRDFVKKLLNRVWEVYGGYSAVQLSNMTHATGTPWDKVSQKYGGHIPKYATIPDEWIRDYFRKQVESE